MSQEEQEQLAIILEKKGKISAARVHLMLALGSLARITDFDGIQLCQDIRVMVNKMDKINE